MRLIVMSFPGSRQTKTLVTMLNEPIGRILHVVVQLGKGAKKGLIFGAIDVMKVVHVFTETRL